MASARSLLLLMCATCGTPASPTTSTATVTANFLLDMPARGRAQATTYSFEIFAGAATTSFSVGLDVQQLGPGTTILAVDGAGATVGAVAVGALPGVVTPVITGNVAILRVTVPPLIAPPRIRVTQLNEMRRAVPFVPTVEPRAAKVNAWAMTPGQPVDMVFTVERTNPNAPAETFFFSVSGLGGAPFDVVLFGGGAARIADPESQGFPIVASSSVLARLGAPRDATSLLLPEVQLTRFTAPRGGVVIAVSNDGLVQPEGIADSRHVRLVVLPVGAPQLLAFPSTAPAAFVPVPVGVDADAAPDSGATPATLGACTNWQGISPNVTVTTGGFTLTTPVGSVTAPGVTLSAPIPPICYDGHPGTDFSLGASFLAQAAGVPVTAAASGTVVSTRDGLADTCFADPRAGFAVVCPDQSAPLDANSVVVRQNDGTFAMYLHLRRGSVAVAPGDRVVCGDHLGEVGSSGDSSSSHLHFELRAPPGDLAPQTDLSWQAVRGVSPSVVDPYSPNRWRVVAGNTLPAPACP